MDPDQKQQTRNLLRYLKTNTYRKLDIVNKFEKIFTLLKLRAGDETISEQMQTDIVEFFQVRNLLVHRRGLVDTSFLQKCPWLQNVKLGEHFVVTNEMFRRYADTATTYTYILRDRIIHEL